METYTPGYGEAAAAFMVRRRLDPNGAFFLPHLRPGISVLDCGCGPGTITRDIAQRIAPGRVVGLDFSADQVAVAIADAAAQGIANVEFRQGSAYALPFDDNCFDAVFSHALLEHLKEPDRAVAEFRRVLKPGGMLGVCTPDWGGGLPARPAVGKIVACFRSVQATAEAQWRRRVLRAQAGNVSRSRRLRGHRHAIALRELRSAHRDRRFPGGEP